MITYPFFSKNVKERLDPYYLMLQKNLQKLRYKFPLVSLETLLKENPQYGANEIAIDGNPSNDTRYVRITDIDKYGKLKNEEWKTAKNINEKYLLKDDDVLFARSGATAGKTFIYNHSVGKAIFAGYLIKFKIDASRANPKFIFYFTQLSPYTEWVKFIQRPSGQPNINSKEFKSINISLPPREIQDIIVEIMQIAYKDREEKLKQANELLSSISGYVRQQLDITYTEPEEKPTFTTSSNEVKGKRLDPKKYSQKPKAILTAIKKAKYSQLPLNNLIVANISGEWGNDLFDNNAKADKDTVQVKVLRNTNFDNSLNLNLEDVAERLIEKNKFVKNKLQNGDILIEKSGGSPIQPVGRVAIFDNIKGDYCFSNFLQCIRINETKCLPYYLFVYLKSIYALNYMEYLQNQTTGIKNLIWEEFTDTPIVLPPKDTQEKLAEEAKDRMTKATALRHEASTVLDEAKKQVEEMILN